MAPAPLATPAALAMTVMVLNGAAAWAVSTPNNHRLTGLVPELPGVVISLNSSGIYAGQAMGAALGGILLGSGLGAAGLCLTGAGIAVGALGLHMALMGR